MKVNEGFKREKQLMMFRKKKKKKKKQFVRLVQEWKCALHGAPFQLSKNSHFTFFQLNERYFPPGI